MAQDSDVARVAAAMNAPGFKYRSFGNEPVRIRPGTTGTLAQPPAPPPAFVEDDVPLVEPLPLEPYPEPAPPEPLAYEDSPGALYSFDSYPDPLPELPPLMAEPPPPPPPAPAPVVVPVVAPVKAPAALPPTPAPVAPPAPLPQVAQSYPPPAAPASSPLAAGGFRLLESIGHRPGDTRAPAATATPGGTLGLLRRAAETGAEGGTTLAGMSASNPFSGPMPPLSPSGHQSGLLPAAAVTVPLSDVMRLIAAGATPPPSPFDAFRAALGAQPGR